jgi:hypothetical protein
MIVCVLVTCFDMFPKCGRDRIIFFIDVCNLQQTFWKSLCFWKFVT